VKQQAHQVFGYLRCFFFIFFFVFVRSIASLVEDLGLSWAAFIFFGTKKKRVKIWATQELVTEEIFFEENFNYNC